MVKSSSTNGIIKYLVVIGTVLATAGCGTTAVDATFTSAITPLTLTTPTRSVQLLAYVADDDAEHNTGLGNVATLGDNQAMVFVWPEPLQPTFWMKDVEYPIDIVWVNDQQVVGVESAVAPELPTTPLADYRHYTPPAAVTTVLELPAGTADRLAITAGTTVAL